MRICIERQEDSVYSTERLAAKSGQLQTVWSSKRNGTMG